nr:beta/gamma crystallin family protein [uncultured Duganella sp.]
MKKILPRLLNAALMLAAPLVFATAARAGEITLYTHDNFGGPAITVRDAVPDLVPDGFNDRASSVRVRSGRWQLCEHANFGGHCIVLEPGEYRKLDGFNDVLTSLREVGADDRGGYGDRGDRGDRGHDRRGDNGYGGGRRGGAPIVLYSQSRFNGSEVELRDDIRKLDRLDFNDQAGSVIIREGNWQLCDDADFRGKCVVLSPGRYDNLRDMGDRISSVRRVR